MLMRVLLYKLTPKMIESYFWARKLNEIIDQKMLLEMTDVKIESKLSPKDAVNQLIVLNKEGERAIQALLVEI